MTLKYLCVHSKKPVYVISVCLLSSLVACIQADKMHLNGTFPAVTEVHVKSDIQGGIGGYRCVGDAINLVANVQDCGGVQNVETIVYPYAGEVYAQSISAASGEATGFHTRVGRVDATALLPGAVLQIGTAPVAGFGATVPWQCENCTITVNGSVFRYREDMPLNALVYTGFGAIEDLNNPNNLALRLGGCAGLTEVSGQGLYANKVGTICVNGTLSFAEDFTSIGGSACTIVIHDPVTTP